MAVPKQKRSRSKRGGRRAHQKIKPLALTRCPQCKSLVKPHTVCLVCGTYKGVEVIDIDKRKRRKEHKEGKEKEKEIPGQ
jgi:large subunit ribosomal protein L32